MATQTVALVDDEASVRRALARLLRSAGFDVVAFASAEEFLHRAPGQTPACLVVDVHLRGMSGIDLVRALVQVGTTLPVLLMTASDEPRTWESLKGIGNVTRLAKPVDAVVLIEALKRAIRSASGGRRGAGAADLDQGPIPSVEDEG